MKISEVIEELKNLQKISGDGDLTILHDGIICAISEIYYDKKYNCIQMETIT